MDRKQDNAPALECEAQHSQRLPAEKFISLTRTQLVETETGRVVLPNVIVARSIIGRTMGLIGKRELSGDSGLWLEPCNGIHTFGMRFAIDVIAFDAAGTVLRTWERVRPFRVCLPVAHGRAVLELPVDSLSRLQLDRTKHYRLNTEDNESRKS